MDITKIKYDGAKLSVTVNEGKDYSVTHKRKLQGHTEFDRWWNQFRHELRVILPVSSKMVAWVEEIGVNEDKSIKVNVAGSIEEIQSRIDFTVDSIDADSFPSITKIFEQVLYVLDDFTTKVKKAQLDMFEAALEELHEDASVTITSYSEETGEVYDDPGDVDDNMESAADDTDDPAVEMRSRRLQAVR